MSIKYIDRSQRVNPYTKPPPKRHLTHLYHYLQRSCVFAAQVRVMLDILLHFNWTYVSVVYSEGDYGQNAVDQFQLAAASSGICVGLTRALARHTDVTHAANDVISRLIEIKAQVVILFTHLEETRTLFGAVQQQQLIGRLEFRMAFHSSFVRSLRWSGTAQPNSFENFSRHYLMTVGSNDRQNAVVNKNSNA